MAIIKFENVKKSYQDKFSALRGIDLVIQPGEFVSIVGRSGAGKTTLTKMIYAEDFPDNGKVFYGKRSTDEIRKKLLPFYRRNFGTVFHLAIPVIISLLSLLFYLIIYLKNGLSSP
jgi:cell division transport system ATP-binding protein